MRRFRPELFDTPMTVLIPETSVVKGVTQKTFTESEPFFGSFKTYGGSENASNNVYTVYDTAIIETWYTPIIQANTRVKICETGEVYEVINRPEDIEMRHQYLKFKVQKVGGKP